MFKKVMVTSGLAILSAGLASMSNAGYEYVLDPKRIQKLRKFWQQQGQALLNKVEQAGEVVIDALLRDSRKVGRQLNQALLWAERPWLRPRRSSTLGASMAATGLGLSAGAGLMYFFDPQMGRERRALVRDRVSRTRKSVEHEVTDGATNLGNKVQGVVTKVRGKLHIQDADHQLLGKLKNVAGYVITHPESIRIQANHGTITIGGEIAAEELDKLLSSISAVRGVKKVRNELKSIPSATADQVAGSMTSEPQSKSASATLVH